MIKKYEEFSAINRASERDRDRERESISTRITGRTWLVEAVFAEGQTKNTNHHS